MAAATNFAEPLAALRPLFERASGHTLVISSGSTGQLYAQIRSGAPYDVLLAADAERPALLESEGAGVAGTRFTYAIGRLALWSARGDVVPGDGPALLRQADFRSLAMANPRLAPYGLAAQEALENLGLWEALQERVVLGENIGQTFALVASGNAPLGFVALSQIQRPGAAAGGSAWLVPEALHEPILQQAILLERAAHGEAARAFLDFLRGAEARAVIARYGYGTDDS